MENPKMKLVVWARPPSLNNLKRIFKQAAAHYFLNRQVNTNLLFELYELFKDYCFFIVSAFFELQVNLKYSLYYKSREFGIKVNQKLVKTGASLKDFDIYSIFLNMMKTKPRVLGDVNILKKTLVKNNPVLIVANHPYPPIDGVTLMSIVHKYRRDFAIMANSNNSMLSLYSKYAHNVLGVHMAEGILRTRDTELARRSRIKVIRKSIRCLEGGGCLIVFPAGQGSKAKAWGEEIKDVEWFKGIGLIVKQFVDKGKPLTVLPMFVEGHMGGVENSQRYQKAVIENPRKLCAALQHALFNPPSTIDVNFSTPLSASEFVGMAKEDIVDKLRKEVYKHTDTLPIAIPKGRI